MKFLPSEFPLLFSKSCSIKCWDDKLSKGKFSEKLNYDYISFKKKRMSFLSIKNLFKMSTLQIDVISIYTENNKTNYRKLIFILTRWIRIDKISSTVIKIWKSAVLKFNWVLKISLIYRVFEPLTGLLLALKCIPSCENIFRW